MKLGSWCWSLDSPRPPLSRLLGAPFWTEAKWQAVRASFATQRTLPPLDVSGEAAFAELTVPPRGGEAADRVVVVYKTPGAVPARAEEMAPVCLAILEARADTRSGRFETWGRHEFFPLTGSVRNCPRRTVAHIFCSVPVRRVLGVAF